jgi:hypothetical protein
VAKASNTSSNLTGWILHTLPVAALILSLFYYWFAVADRYTVFLYYHDMGPLVPDTSPFSRVTGSRYWMAGLVASGAVMVLYAAANWLLGRLSADYCPPSWWRVWALCAVPLLIGIPLITLTANEPTLPLANAAQITLVTLAGLALALLPGKMAARRPWNLVWLAADGWGLMLVMSTIISLERIQRWLERGGTRWVRMTVVVFLAGVAWLLIVTGARVWRRTPVLRATEVFIAGLCVAYLLMPLLHHVMFTDGYYYISDSDNFFATNVALQIVTWLIAAAMVAGVTRLRKCLETRRASVHTHAA